jgi:hypothetical protein
MLRSLVPDYEKLGESGATSVDFMGFHDTQN